jgi:hypothetical protein
MQADGTETTSFCDIGKHVATYQYFYNEIANIKGKTNAVAATVMNVRRLFVADRKTWLWSFRINRSRCLPKILLWLYAVPMFLSGLTVA